MIDIVWTKICKKKKKNTDIKFFSFLLMYKKKTGLIYYIAIRLINQP